MSIDPKWVVALIPIMLIAGGYAGLLGAVEVLRRRSKLSGEATRKLAHVGGGLIGLAFPVLISAPWHAVGIAVAFSTFFAVTRRTGRLRAIHDVPRPSLGAELYPLGIAAAFVLAQGNWVHYAIAVLALTVGDSAAAIVGGRWARRRFCIWGTARSLEGTAAALAATLAAALLVLWIWGPGGPAALLTAIVAAVAAAVAEAVSPRGTDNFVVPVAVVLTISAHPAVVAGAWAMVGLLLLGERLRGAAVHQRVSASVAG